MADNRLTPESLVFPEVSSIDTPPHPTMIAVANKAGVMTQKEHDGTETALGGTSNIGAGVSKTIDGSDTVATGSDRNLIISANSGTSDSLREITGLTVGDSVYLRAASGHTITVQHNHASATVKIILTTSTNEALDEQNPMKLTLVDTNVLAQDLFEIFGDVFGPGFGGATDNAVVRWNGITGVSIQDSSVIITDNGTVNIDTTADDEALIIRQHASQSTNVVEILDSGLNLQVAFTPNGGSIWNEEGNDVDHRWESDTDANNLFSDGGNNNVGFGTGTPDASAKVDISSTTKGALLPRMTTSQRGSIASPADGLTVYDTDYDMYFAENSGASAYHAVGAYTQDGIPFKDPTAQTWNNLNHGGGTYTEDTTNRRLYLRETGTASAQLRGWYFTAPSVPYTAVFHVKFTAGDAGVCGVAVGFRQNSTSELHTINWSTSTGDLAQFTVVKWDNATTINSNYIAATVVGFFPHWFKIEDNNTNRIISISEDGINWTTIHTIGRTDFLTADELFFGMLLGAVTTYQPQATLLSLGVS